MIDGSIQLTGWFDQPGAYVLVDGQFGSTGKGLMAGWLAEYGGDKITHVTTNAGPNSGHTAYYQWAEGDPDRPDLVKPQYDKVLTQQLPVASVFLRNMGYNPVTLLNAGAVIDPDILAREAASYGFGNRNLAIHPAASIITEDDRQGDRATVDAISGTGKGVGPAMSRKVMRRGATYAESIYQPTLPKGHTSWDRFWDWPKDVVFVETAQGYSLGLNSAPFFPYTTSRECTVMQAISDARIPARKVRKVIACFRTYPIRVGATEAAGTSGGWYPDQQELEWSSLGLEPELTTVTKRVRRIASWSRIQFRESVAANEPDVIFLNFCNYLNHTQQHALVDTILMDYRDVMGKELQVLLGGFGPHSHQIEQLA